MWACLVGMWLATVCKINWDTQRKITFSELQASLIMQETT